MSSYIPGSSAIAISSEAHDRYCHLHDGQPLLLELDGSKVAVKDLMGAICGYVAEQNAPIVAGKISSWLILMAKAIGPCLCIARQILIWSDGDRAVEIEASIKRKPSRSKNNVKEKKS